MPLRTPSRAEVPASSIDSSMSSMPSTWLTTSDGTLPLLRTSSTLARSASIISPRMRA